MTIAEKIGYRAAKWAHRHPILIKAMLGALGIALFVAVANHIVQKVSESGILAVAIGLSFSIWLVWKRRKRMD